MSSDVPVTDIAPDQAKRDARQWLSTYQHLKARWQAVTAELGAGPTCEALRGKDIEAASAASNTSLQRLQSELWSQVNHARQAVATICHMLAHARPGRAGAVEQVASAIDAADQALAAARAQQCSGLEALYAQEAQLEAEIEAIATRLDADIEMEAGLRQGQGLRAGAGAGEGATGAAVAGLAAGGRPRASSAGPRRPASRPRARRASMGGCGGGGGSGGTGTGQPGGGGGGGGGTLAPEVRAYNDFLSEHGPTGGWDPEDHDEFLAVLRSCGGDYAAAAAIAAERAVGYTRAEVVAHARWHMELCDLEVRKRVALEAWRQERQRRRGAAATAAAALGSDTAELAQRERERDQESRVEAAAVAELKRAMAARWRAERLERQRAEAEAARQRAEAAAAARREEAERRQAANKAVLAACKQAKEQQRREAERRAAAEAAIRAALAAPTPQQRQRVADRSRATWVRRQALVASREEERGRRERVQQQILDKVRVEAPSDPSRLLQGTTSHTMRLEAQRAEERAARDSGFILHVPRRVTPAWRAGLQGG